VPSNQSFVLKGLAGGWLQGLGGDHSADLEVDDQALLKKLGYMN